MSVAPPEEVETVDVTYDAPPTLGRFMDSDAFVRAVVGPIGSGKSSGCVMEILRRAVEQAPLKDGLRRTRFAVIRNTRPQLQDTTRKTFEQWIPEELGDKRLGGGWNETEFTFTIAFDDVRCEVLFRALDRPKDVRKVLSLELTGAYINEMREVPKEVFDGLQGRVGRYPSKADGGPTWFGVWGDTNPWHMGHWGYQLFSVEKPEGFELFEQPDGLGPDAENVSNLVGDYYRRISQGKDSEWVDEYCRGKYPKSDKGSVYGALLATLQAAGRVCDFEHPNDGVFAVFDLGVSDATAIWWFRVRPDGVEWVDHYESHGQGASHYFKVLRSKPYQLRMIWLPHDARARTFVTGSSTHDAFLAEFGPGMVSIVPDIGLESGIGAMRWVLEQPGTRFHTRCSEVNGEHDTDGVAALRAYRYEWDDDNKVYRKRPLHDWSSHTSDSARYGAVVAQLSEQLTRPPEKPKRKGPDVVVEAGRILIDDSELFGGNA